MGSEVITSGARDSETLRPRRLLALECRVWVLLLLALPFLGALPCGVLDCRVVPQSGPYRYERLYGNHVMQKQSGLFRGWDHFQATKAAFNKSTTLQVYNEWREWSEANANFLDRSILG